MKVMTKSVDYKHLCYDCTDGLTPGISLIAKKRDRNTPARGTHHTLLMHQQGQVVLKLARAALKTVVNMVSGELLALQRYIRG